MELISEKDKLFRAVRLLLMQSRAVVKERNDAAEESSYNALDSSAVHKKTQFLSNSDEDNAGESDLEEETWSTKDTKGASAPKRKLEEGEVDK